MEAISGIGSAILVPPASRSVYLVRVVNVLLWHGWVLDGAGSNVYTARVAEVYRRQGHDVTLICQEPHPERFAWVDAWGTASRIGVSIDERRPGAGSHGRCTLLRPRIGSLLPVFVVDEYEGFSEVKRFVDLSDEELDRYLRMNVEALRAVAVWRQPDVVVAGHAVPGPVVVRRALGDGFVAKVHGSDLEYAVREQRRCRDLAAEGLGGARVVAGASVDVLRRCEELVPEVAGRTVVVAPGVEVQRFRPRSRAEALEEAAALVEAEPERIRGRPEAADLAVRAAVAERDAAALDGLARTYDQTVPDPVAAARLRALAGYEGPLVGYIGKFIMQKGVHHLLAALATSSSDARALLIGFGLQREWLAALVDVLDREDAAARSWWEAASGEPLGLDSAAPAAPPVSARGLRERLTFTGRLDHRYAPPALAAMDVLVVPSILAESFGMVAVEGAAAGALPLVARHSGLAEIAAALESHAGHPGLFSFEPGPGAPRRIADGLHTLLALPAPERRELAGSVADFSQREWTWERTARRLLELAAPGATPDTALGGGR
jgi:glycosyltransferase involved in cell wall biosynthesis